MKTRSPALTIPGVAPVSAAMFLGLIGDPRAYDSSRQILKLAGMSLVERSSGTTQGQPRISKRGKPLLLDQLGLYREQLRAVERSMEEVMAELPEAACLMSIPRVAPVAAGVFLGSLGDVHAYRSSRQVLKLAGMSLIVSSSGTRVGNERLSKHGRPILRRLSFMLGLRAVRSDGLLREPYLAMLARNGGRKIPAVVAMGRRMLCLMFAVAKERRTFTPEPPVTRSAMV